MLKVEGLLMVELIRMSNCDEQRCWMNLLWSSLLATKRDAIEREWQQSKCLLRSQILLLVVLLLWMWLSLFPVFWMCQEQVWRAKTRSTFIEISLGTGNVLLDGVVQWRYHPHSCSITFHLHSLRRTPQGPLSADKAAVLWTWLHSLRDFTIGKVV